MSVIQGVLRKLWGKLSFLKGAHRSPYSRYRGHRQGFTLTEIMIASMLFSVVMLVAWTGLMSALNMSQQAQAKTARKVELNTALDVLTNEVRQAQGVNRSANKVVSHSVSMDQVVTDAGVNLNDLGNYGDIALYVELPTDSRITSCQVDDVSIPADPVDKVVYDVRPSPAGWLKPNALVRYGRIPDVDGSINPCSAPIGNDIIADAIAKTTEKPACDGVITGSNGFHTCMQGDNVELLFKSSIDDLNTVPISSAVTPRSFDFKPTSILPDPLPIEPTEAVGDLFLNYSHHNASSVNLSWGWNNGREPDELSGYRLIAYDAIRPNSSKIWQFNSGQNALKNLDLNTISSNPLDTVCFALQASVSDYVMYREKCVGRNLIWLEQLQGAPDQ